MSKVIHYGVDGEVPCSKIGSLLITDNKTDVTCKRCLKRLKNNPEDPFNKYNKKCAGCGDILPVDDFWENKSENDGKCSRCIKCIRTEKGTYFESEVLPEGCKKCTLCGEVKEFSDFSKKKDRNIGLASRCKKCYNENNRPKKIHLVIVDKSFCGDVDAVKFSENINEANCERCLKRYNDEIEFSLNNGKKKCRNCKEIKDVDKFLNNSQCKDGKHNYCRECQHGPYKEKEEFEEGYRRCTKCGEIKQLDEFSNSQIGPHGKVLVVRNVKNNLEKRIKKSS